MRLCRCGAIVKGSCNRCSRQADKARGTTVERGYGYDWQQLADRYRKQHPLCEQCIKSGKTTAAEHVHHIVPVSQDRSRRLDETNLMSICEPCHRHVHAEGCYP